MATTNQLRIPARDLRRGDVLVVGRLRPTRHTVLEVGIHRRANGDQILIRVPADTPYQYEGRYRATTTWVAAADDEFTVERAS